MESQDPIEQSLNRLNLGDNQKLKERAQYYYSQCSKVPPRVFSKGMNARPIISIHLACESLGISDFDQTIATRLAMCTPPTYANTLNGVRKCLNIQPKVTMKTIGVALGCTSMIPYVEKFFEEFQARYLESLSAAKRIAAGDDLELASWKASAFYICSKALGAKLDKESLSKLCSCTSLDLTRVAKIMDEHCKDLIVQLKKENTRSARPSRKANEDDDEGQEEESEAKKKRHLKRQRTKSDLSTKENKEEDSKESQVRKKSKLDELPTDNVKTKESRPEKVSIVLEKRKAPVSGIVSMIPGQHYKDTKRYRDYVEWREAKIKAIRSV
ncbi:hypothetical protein BC943DRAFT_315460 [Umbelopsis sp. AD052]|nr:hypothetical protein BC943DRAFT_315460 [Umbelopsis sp. AD052]